MYSTGAKKIKGYAVRYSDSTGWRIYSTVDQLFSHVVENQILGGCKGVEVRKAVLTLGDIADVLEEKTK